MDQHSPNDPRGIGQVAETLLHYAQTKTTFRGTQIKTIEAQAYTDPSRFQQEIETIFHRLPLVLAHTSELREPGSYKAMDVLGKPILLTRDKAGKVHAHLNVCTHRGTPLVADGCGRQARFTCPYHAWTFGLDGTLLAVAGADSFGPFDRTTRNLTALPCEERAGMIFGVLTPGAPIDIDAYFAGMLDDFEAMDFASFAYLGSRVIEGANWKIAFDGNLEGYHFATLHPTTIHPRSFSNLTHYEAFGPHLRIGFAQTAIAEKLGSVARETWPTQENHGFDFVRILFPNVSIFVAPEITQIMQIFPGRTPGENRTVLSYFRGQPARDETEQASIEQMMDWLRDVVLNEDYALGLRLQKGLSSGALQNIILGQNERGNQFFHEYVDYYVKGNQPKPTL
jgi:phenylpropionate dioxygenase-like ring-hydroxylating dioxygenase large terminal subunit